MVIEPYLAFYRVEFSLFTVINRQALPVREGVHTRMEVPSLFTMAKDRNTRLWSRVEDDKEYADLVKSVWMQNYDLSGEPDEMLLGIHWQDHEELQAYWLPEWSHLSGSEADRYTQALYHVIQRERAKNP